MGKKILCIDDSTTALLLLEYSLNEAGYQAITALNVGEAIEIINKEIPDLILLDLSMPAVSGYDFLKMRSQLKIEKVPVIVVSAYDSRDSVESTRDLGAVDFVSKPISFETILKKIKTLLNP
ncbi:MAG TPA: response regulator [Bacteroidales bacterium]|nr:response regulator [Bacteroidales bacterium]